jgi:hypothetical protein
MMMRRRMKMRKTHERMLRAEEENIAALALLVRMLMALFGRSLSLRTSLQWSIMPVTCLLAEELGSDLHSSDGWDLPSELDKACTIADGITDERTTEARQLSQHIMGISNVLVDLGMLPVQDIPQLPKSSREVLSAAVLILMRWPPRLICGTEFGTAAAPVILGHLPHRSFAFPSFFLPLRMAVKDVLVYIYIYKWVFIRIMENLCCYIPRPPCSQPQ